MPKIAQLSPHVANLIAAGEVVERPASVIKELLENSVDAGASSVTVEIRDGGMTFIRVTDNGCGMQPEDARTAFLRHATSKLRNAEDLAAIMTMGFRGEALAAIASVSRIDLLTKPTGSISGTSLHLEAGVITEESEAGCPEGTTILVRDLFFNTPARMKFMKADSVEASRITAAVQQQALAHPEVAFRLIRDGKEVLSTTGKGGLEAAAYCIYGRDAAQMVAVESHWEGYTLRGLVSKPTDARPSRNMQTFFVNGRPVRSPLLISALEQAYRNRIMGGKFPACILHMTLPATAVDVNVHPAKTEVKFLSEKAAFDCVHYGVLGALNKAADRPQMQFKPSPAPQQEAPKKEASLPPRQDSFFRTMTTEEFKQFSAALDHAPKPRPEAAAQTCARIAEDAVLRSPVSGAALPPLRTEGLPREADIAPKQAAPILPEKKPETSPSAKLPPVQKEAPIQEAIPEQEEIPLPPAPSWRLVGELYRSYVIVEQGEDAFLIDKHAAHERILFEKLKANQEVISAQVVLAPLPVRLSAEACGELLANADLLLELGFELGSFGENTVVLRQIPMDLSPEDAAQALETIAVGLLSGRREDKNAVRDEVLHTVACKAAIKAGWVTSEQELLALVAQVMDNEALKYCPHGRPICISLSKKQLEKQFKRS